MLVTTPLNLNHRQTPPQLALISRKISNFGWSTVDQKCTMKTSVRADVSKLFKSNSLAAFFTQWIPDSEFKELEPLWHILASTTDSQLHECHKALIPDMSLTEFAPSYKEVCGHFPGKASSGMSPRDVIRSTCKTDCWHAQMWSG